MEHSFDIELAKEIGIIPAILLRHLYFWVEKNRANERHIHDGRVWTYNSKRAFSIIFPYLTETQVKYALDKLKDADLIETGHFSQDKWDKTLWYTLTQRGENKITGIDRIKLSNVHRTKLSDDARAIKELYTDVKPDITDKGGERARERKRIILNKPSGVKEVIEEAGKRRCVINEQQAQDFIDKFEAISENGTWVKGRNIVTDWRKLITSGWIKCWQREFREGMAEQQEGGRPTHEEFAAEIAAERAALGLS